MVFLDVRQDRYFAFDAAQAGDLGHLVRGWPRLPQRGSCALGVTEAEVAELLAKRGLLTEDLHGGKDATPVRIDRPADEVVADDFIGELHLSVRSIAAFVVACLFARLTLQLTSFEKMISRAHRRRERVLARRVSSAFDRERAHRAVATFATLRPYFFSAKDACLFEALALLHFLAALDIHPNWVFGVQACPFAAHCWLQHGGTVLNDTSEHVSRYSPIMVI
ncbi:MAG TPA: lasso peptide biosynthesis B2 protein [Steroidobacteraceae bacterium]|nr:lasso peptide biosynthesis B2 protein [Steroidobacteraceae bacterium]